MAWLQHTATYTRRPRDTQRGEGGGRHHRFQGTQRRDLDKPSGHWYFSLPVHRIVSDGRQPSKLVLVEFI